jgi:hypothetical protein
MYQTGFFQQSTLTPTDEIVLSRAWSDESVCRQVLRLMGENQLVADLSNPDDPRIIGPGAEQVPSEVRDVLIDCSRRRPSGTGSGANHVD